MSNLFMIQYKLGPSLVMLGPFPDRAAAADDIHYLAAAGVPWTAVPCAAPPHDQDDVDMSSLNPRGRVTLTFPKD
jgi:hypothetical protein